MSDTKEKILMTALHLFARDGYEAVSVSMIAGELGMTKGALYKHYKNKRDIFDHIVGRMYQIDAERAQQYEVPQEKYEAGSSAYKNQSVEKIKNFTAAQLSFWTEDAFASDFRKMLTLEQYRSPEMSELYNSCVAEGPVDYMEDIFRGLIAEGVFKEADPRQLAVAFYAPLYLLISILDHTKDKGRVAALLDGHIERFIQYHSAEKR